MLNTLGIHDDAIHEFVASSNVMRDQQTFPSYPHHTEMGSRVQRLEQLLEPRRPRCLGPSVPLCPPSSQDSACPTPANALVSINSRDTSIATPTPTWDDSMRRTALASSIASCPLQGQLHQPSQYITDTLTATAAGRTALAMGSQGLGQASADRRSPAAPDLVSANVSAATVAPLSPPSYTYAIIQPYSSASVYNQLHPNSQQLLLHSPADSSAVPSNYM